jgi:nucleolar protein 6
MSTKLSKRKQKALAFRGKKENKDTTSLDDVFGDEDAIPLKTAKESQSAESSWLGNDTKQPKSTKHSKRKRKDTTELATSKSPSESTSAESKKRKLGPGPDNPSKKRKTADDQVQEPSKRYIVFVGNLPHLPSEDLLLALKSHFPVPPTHIRIPTKKGTAAPQGFAFLEFDSAPALEKALRCHHTLLLKRKINVELTAGGGGKSENRMEKIKKRNEGLEIERKKRMEEEAKKEKKEKHAEGIHPDRLKRMEV